MLFSGGLFLGVLIFVETGQRIGRRHLILDPEGARRGVGAVEGAVFGLLGLLVDFTFSGAASRFDVRRQLVLEEPKDIGTAWQRLDLLPPAAVANLQGLFRQYLDSRLETHRKLPDIPAAAELAVSIQLQNQIWTNAAAACRAAGSSPAHMLLLPALNNMFDIATTRIAVMRMHPLLIIFAMLGLLSLAASLLAGYGMARDRERSWTHILGFAAVMAITVYVITDIEYPRLGHIRVDTADQVLMDLRAGMN